MYNERTFLLTFMNMSITTTQYTTFMKVVKKLDKLASSAVLELFIW